MSFQFDAAQGPIFVVCELSEPRGTAVLRMIVDTGAMQTLDFRSGQISLS